MRAVTIGLLAAGLAATLPAQSTSPFTTIIPADSQDLHAPVVSPDNRWLVMVRAISNTESRLVIRALAGGPLRELPVPKGTHENPFFSPNGDRLFFISSAFSRAPSLPGVHIVSAPFDLRAGALAGDVRQVTLDAVRVGPRLLPRVSPDGQWLVYSSATPAQIKVIPSTGGNTRTVLESAGTGLESAAAFRWSRDSRHVHYYQLQPTGQTIERRVTIATGESREVRRIDGVISSSAPDGRFLVTWERGARARISLRDSSGRVLASTPTQRMVWSSFSADGRFLYGDVPGTRATVKLVPASGGPIREGWRTNTYDWPTGWDQDSRLLIVADGTRPGESYVADMTGKILHRPPSQPGWEEQGLVGNQVVYMKPMAGSEGRFTMVARPIAGGPERELARDLLGGCCEPVGATGVYYGVMEPVRYARQRERDRYRILRIRLDSAARSIAEIPASRISPETRFAVHGDRVLFNETVGDTTYLRLASGTAPITTVYRRSRKQGISEWKFSKDGRKLALVTLGTQLELHVLSLDAAGNVQGAPQVIAPPFDYFFEVFWRPDGTGVTVIAQPRGSAVTEIALIRLADPTNPVLLTKADPQNKWGHAPSPDGQWIAYPSEIPGGGAIQRLDVQAFARAAGRR